VAVDEFSEAGVVGALQRLTHDVRERLPDILQREVFEVFPNWEGAAQKRSYKLEGDELSYRVPARPDGNTLISIWRRLN